METINIGNELKILVDNISNLINNVSSIKRHVNAGMNHVPIASDKLTKITHQTELATGQLMDILDKLSEDDATALNLINKIDEKLKDDDEAQEMTFKLREIVDKSQEQHFKMLETMQFQDLTTQQINYVGSILDKIQSELLGLIKSFSTQEFNDNEDVQEKEEPKNFDPNAQYKEAGSNQDDVDALLEQYSGNGDE